MNTTLTEAPSISRTLAVGPELQPTGGTHFRVWAPKRKKVDVVLLSPGEANRAVTLDSESNGYFSGLVAEATAGSQYKFRLDQGDAFPDPASYFQPEGPHGP